MSTLKSDRVEISNGVTRSFHVSSTGAGFLKTDGTWDMYANNSGQVWAANYGWLHDYFFNSVTNCGGVSNCGGSYSLGGQITLTDQGGVLKLGGFISLGISNCNCACQCDCM